MRRDRVNWYLKVLKNYVTFDGRARRKEYWLFFLINLIISIILSVVDSFIAGSVANDIGLLSSIYSLAVFLPGIAVSIRRLHDTGRTGWWLLLVLIPLIGAIVLLIFMAQDSKPGVNRFGANPKEFTA